MPRLDRLRRKLKICNSYEGVIWPKPNHKLQFSTSALCGPSCKCYAEKQNRLAKFKKSEKSQNRMHINDLPREILRIIFQYFNVCQGKYRGDLSQVVRGYVRNPANVSFDRGYEIHRAAMFSSLFVCKLWCDIVLEILFYRAHSTWSYHDRKFNMKRLLHFIIECQETEGVLPSDQLGLFVNGTLVATRSDWICHRYRDVKPDTRGPKKSRR